MAQLTAEEKIEKVKDFRPIDDVFFEVLAQNPEVCQELLRTIMEDDELVVEQVTTQASIRNIYGRSVRLDALCKLGNGARVNIELQRADNDDHLRRVRFNASSITVKESNTGERFENVLDLYVVFISESDFLKGNKTIYHMDKVLRETGEVVDDGLHEIFVNTAVYDGTDIAELMSCFTKKDVDNPRFPKLTSEVRRLKFTEGGASAVCDVMKKYEEVAEENLLYRLVEKGKLSVSEAAQEVNLSDEQFCSRMEASGYKVPAFV